MAASSSLSVMHFAGPFATPEGTRADVEAILRDLAAPDGRRGPAGVFGYSAGRHRGVYLTAHRFRPPAACGTPRPDSGGRALGGGAS